MKRLYCETFKDITRWPQTFVQHIITDAIVTVHHVKSSKKQGESCSMRTLFVHVKFEISLPKALSHIYPRLSCLRLTLNCLKCVHWILAHFSIQIEYDTVCIHSN